MQYARLVYMKSITLKCRYCVKDVALSVTKNTDMANAVWSIKCNHCGKINHVSFNAQSLPMNISKASISSQ